MTQRKPERSPRRGSETRARPHQVKVAFGDAEMAVLDHARAQGGQSRPGFLRHALTAALLAGPPPAVDSIRAYLGTRGWTAGEPGQAGSLWRRDDWEVAVMHCDDDDWIYGWGAVKRIARAEKRPVPDVATDMITGEKASGA